MPKKITQLAGAGLDKPALLGGPKTVTGDHASMFAWPIITKDDERAVLAVLRQGTMSRLDVTRLFEKDFAAWIGSKYALAHCNGTMALQAAMWACGVGRGDEVICPSMTYWASGLPALALGAVPVWADIQRHSLCLDPLDAARRITPRTKAIVVVHYAGYPADMKEIMALARKHKIKVIEDVSHAHGGTYRGKMLGTIGHVGAMSCMTQKALVVGEGGVLTTDDRKLYERALLWCHYERHGRQGNELTIRTFQRVGGLPFSGAKARLNQLASALGRTQLAAYDKRHAEIQKAMNYFWDRLEGTLGIRAHRPPKGGDRMTGAYYNARGLYVADELAGLPLNRFVEALVAEGFPSNVGANAPVHLHPLVNDVDVYDDGKPTVLAQASRDTRLPAGSLPVSESIGEFVFGVPWFKRYRPAVIDQYVRAVKKVVANAAELRE